MKFCKLDRKKQISLVYRFELFLKNRKFFSKPLFTLGVLFLKSIEYASASLEYLVEKTKNNIEGLKHEI